MPRETDLLRVKLVAHTLLDAQIQETALSPVIVSHPFTNSGISALRNEDGSLSMVDLINNSDDCTRWRRKGEDRNKAQDYRDECERVEVERKFSLGKRKCGMGLVTAKLEETAAHVVALSILLLNLRKIQCAFLQFWDWLLGFLQSREKLRVVQ